MAARGAARASGGAAAGKVSAVALTVPFSGIDGRSSQSAGILEPIGFGLRPEVGAISMSGSSVIVAVNAVALKRLRLPRAEPDGR